ncbi:MAG: aminoacyl-histidine dipeptidase [Oscillospiraceae bacterium]|nr:aminoacyl-histidine dipeptidase [Oscillospiraceae bacterium]
MNPVKLAGLEPASVFGYFEEICSMPHGSGNTKIISDYLVNFAKEQGLPYIQDELNNVIIFVPGTGDMEDHAPVIIQGHMDMVCEKDADCPIDMDTQGLDITHDGNYIFANGTTLGGDDGIAVAFAMALAADRSIVHPPLELVITVDEETGMFGAAGIDLSMLKGRMLLNIDSEEEGIFTVSCAGGARATLRLPIARKPVYGPCVRLMVEGLQGGHSGVEIHKNRICANKVMANLLLRINRIMPMSIISINGGNKDNAIARTCCVDAVMLGDKAEQINEIAAQLQEELRNTYDEPELVIYGENLEAMGGNALSVDETKTVIAMLINVPTGVQKWLDYEAQMVQTSLNLGVVKMEEDCVRFTFSVRSCDNQEKRDLLNMLKSVAEKYGAAYSESGEYPAWEYKEDSLLRDTMVQVYSKMYGKQAEVVAIHAGLECGLLSEKLPGLDAVSIGPEMHDIHTSRERLGIASVGRTWEFVLEVLKAL